MLGLASLAAVVLVGSHERTGPPTTPLPVRDRVVIIDVPGLRWQDLEVVDGSVAGDVRLGSALVQRGLLVDSGRVGVVDDVLAVAEMNGAGAAVTAVELDGLETIEDARSRLARLVELDADVIDRLEGLDDDGPSTLVLLVSSAPTAGGSGPTVFGVLDLAALTSGGAPSGSLAATSATTMRAGYVTTDDLAPTVLAALDIEVPAGVPGHPIRTVSASATGGADGSVEGGGTSTAELADLADRAVFHDDVERSVVVVLAVLLGLAALGALGRRGRTVRTFGPIVAAIPVVSLLGGLVPLHHLPSDFVVVAIPVVAMFVAATATASWSSWGPSAATVALSALTWVVLIVDQLAGGRVQVDTVFGVAATSGGRLQGLGEVASALFCLASLATAAAVSTWGRSTRGVGLGWAAWVVAASVALLALPSLGHDAGAAAVLALAAALGIAVAGRADVTERAGPDRSVVVAFGVAWAVVAIGLGLLHGAWAAAATLVIGLPVVGSMVFAPSTRRRDAT